MAEISNSDIGALKSRVDNIEERMNDVEIGLTALRGDAQTIINIVGGASKYGRLVKIHGPRVIAAILAWLIAKGNIDDATLQLLQSIFGIH